MSVLTIGVREAEIPDVRTYHKRIHLLALFYVLLFFVSLAGIGLLVWKGRLFVTLTQRSNVETLVLAFFLVFYTYVGVLSAPGVWGAVKLLKVNLLSIFSRGPKGEEREGRRERAKMAAIGFEKRLIGVGMNVLIEDARRPHEPLEIEISDRHGKIGWLRFDGARLTHIDALRDGSNSLFVFVVQELRKIVADRGEENNQDANIEVVEWKKIDDERTEQYLSLATFARNLERHFKTEPLWPKVALSPDEIERLRAELSKLCPALRSEALLPDWEYEAEHKIPIIPEPLGIISLYRTEKRIDPIAAMGGALLMLGVAFVALVVVVFFPPWVPSS